MTDAEDARKEAAAQLILSLLSPQDSSEESSASQLCPTTEIETQWCAHCTGARLATDAEWCAYHERRDKCHLIPTIHDGRHGATCARCLNRVRKERNATRLRLR